jgi:hypothetical protein
MANPKKTDALVSDRTGHPMLGTAQTLVADAVVAHALNSTFSDTEAEAALNALGVKINAIFDILEAHGLMKDA